MQPRNDHNPRFGRGKTQHECTDRHDQSTKKLVNIHLAQLELLSADRETAERLGRERIYE